MRSITCSDIDTNMTFPIPAPKRQASESHDGGHTMKDGDSPIDWCGKPAEIRHISIILTGIVLHVTC